MLKDECVREEKLQGMMLKCISSEEEKLKQKIQKRRQRASISGRMAASLKLETSAISTCSYGMDSYDNLDTILDEIPFISTGDPDLWAALGLWLISRALTDWWGDNNISDEQRNAGGKSGGA